MKCYTAKELVAKQIAREIFNKSVLDKDDIERIVLKQLNNFNNGEEKSKNIT